MGAENSNDISYEDLMSQFEEVRIEYSQQLGEVRVCRRKDNHRVMVMLKEKWFNQQEAFESFKKKLEKRKRLSDEYNASILRTVFENSNDWCSTTYRCLLVYEYHERTLEKLMRHRKTYQPQKIKFEESDFWRIAKDLVLGLKNYRDFNLCHGDVQPGNIFVLDNKRLKLIDTCFLNDFSTGLDRRLHEYDYFTPLSPQALSSALYGIRKALSYNKEKNDVWGLGITILSLLINEDFNTYYDQNTCQIKFPTIQNRIEMLGGMGYSRNMIQFLSWMLESDEILRPDFVELFEDLIQNTNNVRSEIGEEEYEKKEKNGAEIQLENQKTEVYMGINQSKVFQAKGNQRIIPSNNTENQIAKQRIQEYRYSNNQHQLKENYNQQQKPTINLMKAPQNDTRMRNGAKRSVGANLLNSTRFNAVNYR